MTQRVLGGIRVLDLGRFMAAPYCGAMLADMGAEVIRVEKPGGEWDRRLGGVQSPSGDTYMFLARGRNKKGITLDLTQEKGRELLDGLVQKSDVVLENFAVDAKAALGLTYERLSSVNPRIIVTSLSAFGIDGPYASRVGMDGIAQAMSGAMAATGFEENPPTKSFFSWVDYSTAAHAALGTVLAILHRERTGQGQQVDVSLFDTAANLAILAGLVGDYIKGGVTVGRMGNGSASGYSDCLHCCDGWVMIITHGTLWHRFVAAIGMPALAEDERFRERKRAQHHRELHAAVSPWFASRTVDEVIKLMSEARVPCGRVNEIPDLVHDPQIASRGMLVDILHAGENAPVGGPVIKLSRTAAQIDRGAPTVGQDNADCYGNILGLGEDELASLTEACII